MTASERTQLELAKKDISYMKSDIEDIKTDIKHIKELLERQDGKYITQAFAWKLSGLVISIVALGIAFANWVKNQ